MKCQNCHRDSSETHRVRDGKIICKECAGEVAPSVKTHIAGLGLVIGDRFARQLCAWCGEALVDEDAELMATTDPTPRDPCWPINALIRVEKSAGVTGFVALPETDELPVDCCAYGPTRVRPKLELVSLASIVTK